MKRLTLPIACVALAGTANAVNLNPNGVTLLPGSAAFLGTLIQSETVPVTGINAASEVRFTGLLTAEIYREASGTLDFWYQYTNSDSSPDSVERLTMTNFAGYATDVDYIPADGEVAPTYADRSNDGGVVGFQFQQPIFPIFPGNGVINPGQTSDWLVIKTNAKQWTYGTTSVIDGAVATEVTYAPVPEPASLIALATGAAGLLRARKRRK